MQDDDSTLWEGLQIVERYVGLYRQVFLSDTSGGRIYSTTQHANQYYVLELCPLPQLWFW